MTQAKSKTVVLVTDKQPSSNPRLVKEAGALYQAGYKVTVIYNFWSRWAEAADENIFKTWPGVEWKRVGAHPEQSGTRYFISRVRFKLCRMLAGRFSNSLELQVMASAQFYPELRTAACSTPAAVYIAHNLAALPAAAAAAKKNNSQYAFDAEDFHRAQEGVTAAEAKRAAIIENAFINDAKYITAASPLIAAEYKKHYPHKSFIPVNNVFSKRQQPAFADIPKKPLKLFWFSQTVGLKRGLQDVLSALNLITDFPVEVNILGDVSAATAGELTSVVTSSLHRIHFLQPCDEDELIKISSLHHIGLALEPGFSLNYQIALTNKLFTYMLAGNALIVSGTPAQTLFYKEYSDAAWCYPVGDTAALAAILKEAWNNEDKLVAKRKAAWHTAQTKLNWETEQSIFLEQVNKIA